MFQNSGIEWDACEGAVVASLAPKMLRRRIVSESPEIDAGVAPSHRSGRVNGRVNEDKRTGGRKKAGRAYEIIPNSNLQAPQAPFSPFCKFLLIRKALFSSKPGELVMAALRFCHNEG